MKFSFHMRSLRFAGSLLNHGSPGRPRPACLATPRVLRYSLSHSISNKAGSSATGSLACA
jgi:hypothetical protein